MLSNKLSAAVSKALISGAKGDKARKAVESPDSLFSIAHARIIDLVSEGEIEGFPHGADFLRDVYFDETPVQNQDGTRNFKNFQVDARTGTQDQTHIPGFPAVENELSIGVALIATTPWTRAFTNKQLSAVRVKVGVPAFSFTDSETGDIKGNKVDYAMDIATDGGAFVEVLVSAFNGKASTAYERGHRLELPPSVTTGWIIRVRRLTADSASAYVVNDTQIISATEIIDGKFRYPMSALVGVQVDASQFQSVPVRAYHLKGRKIRVPANYDPVTRTYATTGTGTTGGAWNGTFKTVYSNNPAWVFYDMTTHKRYGLGRLVDELVLDKWALYNIGQYCDEMVSDGFGGTEPRMTCNLYLQKAADAWKVVGDLSSIFRGICYWAGGSVVPVADRPSDPVYTYTNANVEGGMFTYESTSRRARHTAVIVTYNDMTDFCRLKSDYYDDPEGIARFGYQLSEVNAMGCTSRGQAQRFAKWILYSEKLLTNTVSFSVGLEGTFGAPGQIVRLADKHRAGRRIGGRIASSTAMGVVLDALPDPAPMVGDTLIATLPSGVTESRSVSSIVGNGINVSVAFTELPQAESIWAIESNDLSTQLFRLLATEKTEAGYSMAAMQHNPSIFDAVDFGEPITQQNISVIPSPFQMRPASVTITSVERAGKVIALPLLTASWPGVAGAVKYLVQWQKDNGEWTSPQEVHGASSDYQSPFPGVYLAKVSAVNALGNISIPKFSDAYTLADQTLKPGFVATINADIAEALLTAENAQAAADGSIEFFWQAAAPVIGTGVGQAKVGDFWVDTDTMQLWRSTGGVWVDAQDDQIGQALLSAQTANEAASDAQFDADAAISSAAAANAKLSDIASDSILTPGEKPMVIKERDAITAEQAGIDARATEAAVTTEKTAYDTAVSALTTYLATLTAPVLWTSLAGNTTIVQATFKQKFNDVYTTRQTLLNKITTNVKGIADGKVKTWFQEATPTAAAVGDLWFKPSTKKLSRWNGANWTADVVFDQTALDLAISDALTAANNAQSTADGVVEFFWQDSAPVIGAGAGQAKVGDFWVDTNDGNRLWRVTGGAWVDAQDDAIGEALLAAQTAQGTADGKVKTWFGSVAPGAPDVTAIKGIGDLWFNTIPKKLFRWNGSNWSSEISDVTLDQLGGTGVNLMWDEYSVFNEAVPAVTAATFPPFMDVPTTLGAIIADATAIGGFSLRATIVNSSTDNYISFTVNSTDYNLPLEAGKYLVSFYAKASFAGQQIRPSFAPTGGGLIFGDTLTLSATRTRYVTMIDASSMAPNCYLRMYLNMNGAAAGRTIDMDGFMIEPTLGRLVVASPYSRGASARVSYLAFAAAALAQDTADGKIDTFFQAAMPVGAALGDLWFDTDDGNSIWRHNGTTFIEAMDDAIAQAIADAAGAQATADGKVRTFFQSAVPTATALGDLWVNIGDKNKLYRWSGSVWSLIRDVGIDDALNSLIGGGNLIENSEFDDGLVGIAGASAGNFGPMAVNRNGTNYRPPGVNTIGRAQTGVVASTVYQDSYWTIPSIEPNKRYCLSVYMGLHRSQAYAFIQWFDAAAAHISYSIGPTLIGSPAFPSAACTLADFQRPFIFANAPANAVSARVYWRLFGNDQADPFGWLARPMLEEASASQVNPSPWAPSAKGITIRTVVALNNAAFAQSTADGKVTLYRQATAPVTGIQEGDIWIDTDDGKMYSRVGAAWVYDENSTLGQALDQAIEAQDTADGKAATFYSTSTPTAEGIGDLWVHLTTKVVKRWSGSAWVELGSAANSSQFTNGVLNSSAFGNNLLTGPGFASNLVGAVSDVNTEVGAPICDGWKVNARQVNGRIFRETDQSDGPNLYMSWPSGLRMPNSTGNYINPAMAISAAYVTVNPGLKYYLRRRLRIARNITPPAGVTFLARTQIAWYKADGSAAATSGNFWDYVGVSGYDDDGREYPAPADAAYALIVFALYVRNMSGADWTTTGLMSDMRVYNVGLHQVANLDTDVLDGTNYGRFSNLDGYMSGGFRRNGLRFGGSGHRIGNQSNLNQIVAQSVRSATTLSATSAGAVSVAAHSQRYGSFSVAYNAVANAVTGLTQNVAYVIYCVDDAFAGGTRTWLASTNLDAVAQLGDGIVIAGVVTIPASGSSSGGGGGTGNPGEYCVAADSYLPDGRIAADVEVSTMIPCWNEVGDRPDIRHYPVQKNDVHMAECLRMTTESGASIVASETTPMTLRNGACVMLPAMLHHDALVYRPDGTFTWEQVVHLKEVGSRPVSKIVVHQKCYFAGESMSAFIATHNPINIKP